MAAAPARSNSRLEWPFLDADDAAALDMLLRADGGGNTSGGASSCSEGEAPERSGDGTTWDAGARSSEGAVNGKAPAVRAAAAASPAAPAPAPEMRWLDADCANGCTRCALARCACGAAALGPRRPAAPFSGSDRPLLLPAALRRPRSRRRASTSWWATWARCVNAGRAQRAGLPRASPGLGRRRREWRCRPDAASAPQPPGPPRRRKTARRSCAGACAGPRRAGRSRGSPHEKDTA